MSIRLDTQYLKGFVSDNELLEAEKEIKKAHTLLENSSGKGAEFLGWLHLPSHTKPESISEINEIADSIRKSSQVLVVIGIGGSYLGSRAAIQFLYPHHQKTKTDIIYAGNNLDPSYLESVLKAIKGKKISVNIISKSGTTTEPAIAFRVIKAYMDRAYSKKELQKRIVCTTTEKKGTLYGLAKKEGYRCLYIPENVGGRFSVLTAVGLLPMAVSGIDISGVIRGALDFEKTCTDYNDNKPNPAYKYAAIRNILYRKGKKIELLATFHVGLFYIMEWWKQIFAESEGKEAKGLFPATAIFSTDLHSIGQLIQQGERNIFETFLNIEKTNQDIKLPSLKEDIDNLNYLAGKGIDFVNRMALKGTALAHYDGGIPSVTVSLPERSAYTLGALLYFFQRAVGVSGYMLGINPFDQPGVEAYKKNMFSLLGKPR